MLVDNKALQIAGFFLAYYTIANLTLYRFFDLLL